MRQLAERLAKDHERLELLLRELAEGAASPDRSKLCETWNEFETCLTWHLEAEERYLLPLVEAAHRAEVEALLEDHRVIRRLVGELGVLVDLHAISEASVLNLTRMLHEHAQREDRTLYEWADQVASTTIARCMTALLNLTPRGVRGLVGSQRNVEPRDLASSATRGSDNP